MARRAQRAALYVGLAALAASLACGRGPRLPPVRSVEVRSTELAAGLAAAGIGASATVVAAKGALRGAGLPLDERASDGYRATVEVVAFGVVPPRGGAPAVAEVVLELSLAPPGAAGSELKRTGVGRAVLTPTSAQEAWLGALRSAATDAAVPLALDLRAAGKDADALVADLADGDPRARERAVRQLAARGVRSAVRKIEPLVRDPEPAVVRAAVDALAAFRDPASAVVLIEAAQAGDVATTLRLLPILVELGGPDVEGYLLTLESGHGDRAVREAAGEGLGRLRAARPGGGPGR